MKHLVSCLVLLVTAVSCLAEKDEELERPTRVVHGTPVSEGFAQWQVSIQTRYGAHFCGGSLIAPHWVVTASHCTKDRTANELAVGVGGNRIQDMRAHYKVKRIIRHENYNPKTQENDIALLELDNGDQSVRDIGAELIRIENDTNEAGAKCYVTGYGRLKSGGDLPRQMMQAEVPLVNYKECRGKYDLHFKITAGHVCAGGEDKDACQGDSGGPLVCCTHNLGEEVNNCTLVGITSWGIGCAIEGLPGVYSNVAYHSKWISAKVLGKEYVDKPFHDEGGWNLYQQFQNFIVGVLPFSDEVVNEKKP